MQLRICDATTRISEKTTVKWSNWLTGWKNLFQIIRIFTSQHSKSHSCRAFLFHFEILTHVVSQYLIIYRSTGKIISCLYFTYWKGVDQSKNKFKINSCSDSCTRTNDKTSSIMFAFAVLFQMNGMKSRKNRTSFFPRLDLTRACECMPCVGKDAWQNIYQSVDDK